MDRGDSRKIKTRFLVYLILSLTVLFFVSGLVVAQTLNGSDSQEDGISSGSGFIGVALSTGLAALGAGIGVGIVGAAAIGALSENPKMLGRTLIFVGLAEGVAIYGLVISIIILGRM